MKRLRHRAGILPLILCLGGLPMLLAGCNSFALDDGIPNTAPTSTVVSTQSTAPSGPLVRRQTGTYPTFDGSLTAANTQIGDEDAAGTEAQLTALAQARSNGTVSDAEYQQRVAELRRLAVNHGQDAETAIAN